MPDGPWYALAFISAGIGFFGPAIFAGYRDRPNGRGRALGALAALGAMATTGVVFGLNLHNLRQQHINFAGKFAVRSQEVFQLMGYHALLGLIFMILAIVLVSRLFRGHKPEGAIAALAGLLTLGFGAAAVVTTSPDEGDETIMLMLVLFYVVAGCGFLLLISSLVLLLSSLLRRSQPTFPVEPLCDHAGLNLAGLEPLLAKDTAEGGKAATRARDWTWPIATLLGAFAIICLILGSIRPYPASAVPFTGLPQPLRQMVSDLVTTTITPWWTHLLLGVTLLVGACGLLLHQRWGVWVCTIWGAASILGAAADCSLLLAGKGTFEQLYSDRLTAAVAVQAAWGMFPPVALAAWLRRNTIKAQIARWA